MSKKVKLENYIQIQNGYAFKSNLFQNFGIPVVRITNVENGKLNLDKVVYYSEDKKLDKFFIKKNDILLSLTGDDKTLKVCINERVEKLYLNQRVAILRSNELLAQKYLYYSIKKYSLLILEKAKGIAQKNISVDDINSLEIPLPDLDQQKQIAKTLDKAQELIDLRKESIAKLDELAKSIFIDMFGDPVSNPKGWNIEKLDDVCEITSSKRVYKSDYVSEGIPFYKIKEIILKSKNIEPKEIEYISIDAFENFASKFGYPHEGDILVTAVGATIGYFYLVDDEKFYFKDGNLIWLRNYKMDINKKFLLYMFRTKEFKNKILELSKGAAQNALTIVKLKSVFICTPPIDLQNKFTSIIEKIEEQKSLYEKELEKLEENFQALLQQSFKE